MRFLPWLTGLKLVSSFQTAKRGQPQNPRRKPAGCKLSVEILEDRCQPSFLAPVNYTVSGYPQAVVTADFNGDGELDLAVVNSSNSSFVSVMLGNGDGSFRSAVNSAPGSYTQSLAVGDLNGDGKLDLAVANDGFVSVMFGNGDGTFPLVSYPNIGYIGSGPGFLALGDFNGDGRLDLAVQWNIYVMDGYDDFGNEYGHCEGYVNVLLGSGTGSFSGPNITSLGYGDHASAAAADLNGDAFEDFVTVNTDYHTVNVLLGNSSGYLQGPNAFYTGYYSDSVATGDIDADGDTDLVTVNTGDHSVSVLQGDGLGGFSAAANYATGSYPASVVLRDFTGDGHIDMATANSYSGELSVLRGTGNGTFTSAVNSAVGWEPHAMAAGDFNGDGLPDLAVARSPDGKISVLLNAADWSMPADAPSVTINDVSVTEGNTGTVGAAFTVSLSAAYGQPVTVHYATADGTATAGSDFNSTSGTLTFAPGETSKTVTALVKGDRVGEPNETFVVNLSSPTNATIGDSQGVGTIVDDEPRISIGDMTKSEGKKNQTTLFTFTVTLSTAYDQAVTMSFKTTDGSAKTSDSDYVAQTGTLKFKPGETSKTITITVNGDSKKESDETFYLDLFGNSSNSLFTKNRGNGTILNDD